MQMQMARSGQRLGAKTATEIERLLHWAYRDELSKRTTSSAEGIWDRIREVSQRGGIDPGHGAAQRYSHFGLPHPDAEEIERAVAALPDGDVDWTADAENILGDLVALAEINKPGRAIPPRRETRATWSRGRQEATLEPPRDILMVRSLHTAALITMHARMGTRPDWREEMPHPEPTPATRGPNALVVGECEGKNRYELGAYCPLRWCPSPTAIAESRVDYLVWWRGMKQLSESLQLDKFEALAPEAPEMPWRAETVEPVWIYRAKTGDKLAALPLKPQRPVMLGQEKRQRDPGRVLSREG